MKNIITGTVHFSFKGERHSPSVTIELDHHIERTGTLPDLHQLIARENSYDLYSYEYEMMQAEDIQFSQAQGLIADFIKDGQLDTEAFLAAWNENNTLLKLQEIARKHLNINDFSDHPELKDALFEAFLSGQKNTK